MYIWQQPDWPNFTWEDNELSPSLALAHTEQGRLRGTLNIIMWQKWFLNCLIHAFENAHERLADAVRKARFWEYFARQPLNERQIKVLRRVMDNWEGKLTSSKWAMIAKCSQGTAGRDIKDLIKRGALKRDPGGGRSTSYSIVFDQQ